MQTPMELSLSNPVHVVVLMALLLAGASGLLRPIVVFRILRPAQMNPQAEKILADARLIATLTVIIIGAVLLTRSLYNLWSSVR